MACVAAVNIPKGTCSKPFHLHEINTSSHYESWGNLKTKLPLQVKISASGHIFLALSANNMFWPKLIDMAADCLDQNIQLCRYKFMDTLVLQATRDIPAGQRLQLWFSDELMMSDLGINPYLSPSNIKGVNSYVCHECQNEFEKPNLLKLHLALDCNRMSLETIWNRLKPSCLLSLLQLINSPHLPNIIPLLNVPGYLSFIFKQVNSNKGEADKVLISCPADAANKRRLAVHEHYRHHAFLEAVVSKLGKATHGCSCLYCGKFFLNMFVLKIHIRTHTGYKPHKCKLCHRKFGDPSNLRNHMHVHKNKRAVPQPILTTALQRTRLIECKKRWKR